MEQLLFLNLGGAEIILLLIIGVGPFLLTLVCLIDIVKSNFKDPTNKVVWALVVMLIPMLGGIAYLIWGRNQKAKAKDDL